MNKEVITRIALWSGLALATTTVSLFSFSREQKDRALNEHRSRCQQCGKIFPANQLYSHHLLPEQYGGSSTDENHYLACSNCHRFVDREVIFSGRLANGAKVTEVASDYPELISNWDKYYKAARRFSRKQ